MYSYTTSCHILQQLLQDSHRCIIIYIAVQNNVVCSLAIHIVLCSIYYIHNCVIHIRSPPPYSSCPWIHFTLHFSTTTYIPIEESKIFSTQVRSSLFDWPATHNYVYADVISTYTIGKKHAVQNHTSATTIMQIWKYRSSNKLHKWASYVLAYIVMYFRVHNRQHTKHSTAVLEPLLHMLMPDILK